MATRGPDSPREAGDVQRGSTTPGDMGTQGERGRTDEVTGRMSYAQGRAGEPGAHRMEGRDYYREALARASRRSPEELSGGMGGYGRGEEGRRWGMREEFRGGTTGYTEYEPRRGHGERERGYGERGWGESRWGEPERYGARGQPVESEGRGGRDMDMDEMARRYHTDMRFDREALERGEYIGGDRSRWEDRGFAARPAGRIERGGMMERAGMERGGMGYGMERGMEGLREGRMERMAERRGWQREPLNAGEVMTRNPKTLRPEHTLRDAARLMREESVGIVPVTDNEGRLLGLITDRDIAVRAVFEDKMPSQTRVADFMSEDLEVATPDESLHDVLELMGKKQVRRIPVVERDNRLVGIIAVGDIATKADYDEELQRALERISSRRSFWRRLFS